MSDYLEAILIGLVVGTVSFILPWAYKKYAFNRDSEKIIAFIRDSKYTFRSTEAIVEATMMNQSRVQEICESNDDIIQNKKKPRTWRVL